MQILLQKTKKRHEVHIVCFNHLGVAALFAPFSILSETTCTNLSMQDWFCLNIPTKQYLLVLLNISLSYPFLQQVLKNSNWINLNKVSSWRKKFHCTHFLPCENFSEIAARSRYRAEITAEIAARYWKSRWPKTRRDLATILALWNAPRSRRDSRRDRGEMREISAAKNPPRSRRDSRRDRGEIAARYGNVGRQIRGEMLQRDRGEIRKSRRAVSRRGLGGSLAGIRGEKRNS